MGAGNFLFEQGPIRPPSEAGSLLIRVSRNCPWNKCLFCPVYKFDKFSRRSTEDVKEDIDTIAGIVAKVTDLSYKMGGNGTVNAAIYNYIYQNNPEWLPVANWFYYGERSVFLQDADNMIYDGAKLYEILVYLNEKIPGISRITTYARSKSLVKRSENELIKLKEAGLNRIHVGLESGCDKVLSFMEKGVTAAEHIEAGQKVKKAGISLSEYVMPGLGGRDFWFKNAVDTAKALNSINPDFIRLRTLVVHPFSPLSEKVKEGSFSPLDDNGVLLEERAFLSNLEGITGELHSDHILNLLEEINGRLPDDKEKMIGIIHKYFALPDMKQELFRLGRRAGIMRFLADLDDKYLSDRVEELYRTIKRKNMTIDDFIEDIKKKYL